MKIATFSNMIGSQERFLPYIKGECEGLEIVYIDEPPTVHAIERAGELGCEAMIYYDDIRQGEVFYQKMAECGIRYMTTTGSGYDHYDLDAMRKYGIKGANVPFYSPNAIAEHTIMLLLGVLRKLRTQLSHIEKQNFAFDGLMGREIRKMKIGVVGAGRIGLTTIKILNGFGAENIMAYGRHERDEVKQYAVYTPLEQIYKTADVIIFHCNASDENYHMVDQSAIDQMKDGVVLINTARGQLFDTEAVIRGLYNSKISGLGLDVLEGEGSFVGMKASDARPTENLQELLSFENVLFTSHTAFYTDEAYRNQSESCVKNIYQYAVSDQCENEVT